MSLIEFLVLFESEEKTEGFVTIYAYSAQEAQGLATDQLSKDYLITAVYQRVI